MRRRNPGLNYYRVGQILYGQGAIIGVCLMLAVIFSLPLWFIVPFSLIAVAAYTISETSNG